MIILPSRCQVNLNNEQLSRRGIDGRSGGNSPFRRCKLLLRSSSDYRTLTLLTELTQADRIADCVIFLQLNAMYVPRRWLFF